MPKRVNLFPSHPCKHEHVSGRRCAIRVHPSALFCPSHQHGICAECHSMLNAFEPPSGWPKGTGDF